MDFYSLIELEHLKAIHAALEPSLESVWRMKCRAYSQKFFTPLHVVQDELDPVVVLQALYEDQYSPASVDSEIGEIIEKLYTMRDPNYTAMSPQDIEELVDAVLNKEIARLGKKKQKVEASLPKAVEKVTQPIPKSGGMKFDEVVQVDQKAESNKGGFED